MDRNQALGVLDRIHKLRDKLEIDALRLQKALSPLKRNATGHSTRILIGILAGIRRYLIANEEEVLELLTRKETANGKVKKDKSYQSEPDST